ncbi:MAG: type I-C CRISPR-associated endonuclease Cas1 [Ectothiorhodospiraceae bacterium]|nr:type I-C CRISPR-associated endonuclease Cas1 [Ectothiorhodospiraceae bacterium]
MRRHLNTLYVTTEGAWLHKDGANIVMDVDGKESGRVPIHMVGGVVCIGRALLSPQLLGYCSQEGVTVCFLDRNGRFLARVEGPVSGNVVLRMEQYRRSENSETCTSIVRSVVAGKVHNQRAVLRRALRDHAQTMARSGENRLRDAEKSLTNVLRRVATESNNERLRGLEGEAANTYFGVFAHLLRRNGEQMLRFTGRNRRPPLDGINALLSFLYTLLTHDCRSALETVGLDPAVGFLHRIRPGRPSLALDLVEEFRPVLADRMVLSLINRGQIKEKDFHAMDGGAVTLKEGARKRVIKTYQERKQDEVRHPFLDERTTVGLLPQLQARLLSRHLRGDLDGYPPFLWK